MSWTGRVSLDAVPSLTVGHLSQPGSKPFSLRERSAHSRAPTGTAAPMSDDEPHNHQPASLPVCVQVTGELDIATAPLVLAAARRAPSLGQDGLTCDLSAVEFIDAAGVAALITVNNESLAAGVTVRFTNASPCVIRVLSLVGLLPLLQLAPLPEVLR